MLSNMPNGIQVYVSSFARSEAEQLKEQLSAMLSHDSDRDALVESIPKLRQTLRWFTDTLHGVEIDIHECACCGNQATLRVRDKARNESFLCDDQACAAQAQPREMYDLSAASWLVFGPPQPPAKRARFTQDDENEEEQNDEDNLIEGYDYVDNEEQKCLITVYDFAELPQPAAKRAGSAEDKDKEETEQDDEENDLIEGHDYVENDEGRDLIEGYDYVEGNAPAQEDPLYDSPQDAEEEEDVGDGYYDLDDGYEGQ